MLSRISIVSLAIVVLVACGDRPSDEAHDGGAALDAPAMSDGGSDASPNDATVDDAAVIDAGSDDAGSGDAGGGDAGGGDAGSDDAGSGDAGSDDAGPGDAGPADAGPADAGPLVHGVRVLADRACSVLSFDPPSIAVPAGTSFTIRWLNATGCTEIDVDMGGTVPIVIGLAPGASHHDTVRQWCGTYTGRYTFRAYYSPSFPAYLPVDCAR